MYEISTGSNQTLTAAVDDDEMYHNLMRYKYFVYYIELKVLKRRCRNCAAETA